VRDIYGIWAILALDVNLFIRDRPTVAQNSKSTRASGLLQVTHEFRDNFLSKLIRIFTVV
jgi:hypothetical protein